MAGCTPDKDCPTVAKMREEQTKQMVDSAVHAERLASAATVVEQMIESFGKCLESINKYDADTRVALASGGQTMETLRRDIDALGKAHREHATGPDGLHKKDGKLIWGALGILTSAVLYVAGFLLYTHTDDFLKWSFRLFGWIK